MGRRVRPSAPTVLFPTPPPKGALVVKKLQTILDKASTFVAAVLCGAMMVILLANVILRLIPGIGGFKWYIEGGQYLNVFSMMIAGIGITAQRTHLHVELVDSIAAKNPKLK